MASTTIREVLEPFEDDDIKKKIKKAKKLSKQFDKVVKYDSRFEFFVYLLNLYCKTYMFPELVVEFCDSLNVNTLQDLFDWNETVKSDVILSVIEPKLQLELSDKVKLCRLRARIKEFCNLEPNCKWEYGDIKYNLLNMEGLKEVLTKCPIDKRRYIKEQFDCEDFSRTTKSWLSLRGFGHVAFANVTANYYRDGKYSFCHGINMVPLVDTIVFVEPQSDVIWPANELKPGSKHDEMRLRFIQL